MFPSNTQLMQQEVAGPQYQQSTTATGLPASTQSTSTTLTLNFDDNDLLKSSSGACDSPKFTPPSPATTTSSSSALECSSLSDSGFSTSASSNASLSPLPTTSAPASSLTTTTPALPPSQPPTRSNSEKLEAENAVLTNACLGLLELLNSQRGGNPGAASSAYSAILSRVGSLNTSNTQNTASPSTPSVSPQPQPATYNTTTSSIPYPSLATPSTPSTTAAANTTSTQQYGVTLNSQQQQQQPQQQPTLAAPLPTFSFPGASSMSRNQSSGMGADMGSTNNNLSCYGRRKSYGAPPGVWRNPYGYVSTVYVNKKRVYGPLRKTIEDASRDREAMVQAKEYVTSVEEMRAFVREFLKPNPHGGVAESAVLPNLPTLEDEMLVTLQ